MRRLLGVLALCLVAATALAAQAPLHRWGLDLTFSREAFTGASADTGGAVEISPAPRVAYELGLSRLTPRWGVRFAVSAAVGGLRGKTDKFRLDDNSTGVDRYGVGLLLERVVAADDRLRLAVTAGPTLYHWQSDGINDRTVLGARGGIRLGIGLGRISLEEVALVGLSGSPFTQDGVGSGGEVQSLWTWSVGVGGRLGL